MSKEIEIEECHFCGSSNVKGHETTNMDREKVQLCHYCMQTIGADMPARHRSDESSIFRHINCQINLLEKRLLEAINKGK